MRLKNMTNPNIELFINESKIDYKALVTDIVGCAKTPCEKAKAIYKWLCDNISYDAETYFSGKLTLSIIFCTCSVG